MPHTHSNFFFSVHLYSQVNLSTTKSAHIVSEKLIECWPESTPPLIFLPFRSKATIQQVNLSTTISPHIVPVPHTQSICFLVKIAPEDIIECSRSESTKLFWYWKRTHINFFWKKLTIFCKNSIFFISTNLPRYWKAIYWIFLSWVYGKFVQIAYFNHFHNKVKADSYDFFFGENM